jgi:hypothetical protein
MAEGERNADRPPAAPSQYELSRKVLSAAINMNVYSKTDTVLRNTVSERLPNEPSLSAVSAARPKK